MVVPSLSWLNFIVLCNQESGGKRKRGGVAHLPWLDIELLRHDRYERRSTDRRSESDAHCAVAIGGHALAQLIVLSRHGSRLIVLSGEGWFSPVAVGHGHGSTAVD
jgi:hypothetical protein